MASSGQKLFRNSSALRATRLTERARCPVLEGLFGKQVQLQDGRTVTVDENYIRESILDPKAKVAAGYEPIMPNFTGLLSEEQMAQLIAYIKVNRRRPANHGAAPPSERSRNNAPPSYAPPDRSREPTTTTSTSITAGSRGCSPSTTSASASSIWSRSRSSSSSAALRRC